MTKKGCFGKSLGCCLGGCGVSVLLLIASPFLLLYGVAGISWLDQKYDAGEADWAEGISEINDAIVAISGAFVDSMMGTPSTVCTADHCDSEGNAINAEDSSLFWNSGFPFLQGQISNFYSKDIDGFQDHRSLYRFDASANVIDELVKQAHWERNEDSCDSQDFHSGYEYWWWQPELISDPVCYRGYSYPTGQTFYSVMYDPQAQTTYIYRYSP